MKPETARWVEFWISVAVIAAVLFVISLIVTCTVLATQAKAEKPRFVISTWSWEVHPWCSRADCQYQLFAYNPKRGTGWEMVARITPGSPEWRWYGIPGRRIEVAVASRWREPQWLYVRMCRPDRGCTDVPGTN